MVSIYDVLKASNGIYVEDSFAEIWGRKLRGGYEIKTLTGVPPFTFTADGEPLIDWVIHGNVTQNDSPTPTNPDYPVGVGEKTANLFEGDLSQFDNQGGTGSTYQYFELSGDFVMTFTAKNACTAPNNTFMGITNNGGNASGGYSWGIEQGRIYSKDEVVTLKSSDNGYQFVSFYRGSEDFEWILANFTIMLNSGSTALPFEPYGYKLPITCGGTTTNIYLGSATSTRKIKKLVLSGGEVTTVDASVNQAIIPLPDRCLGVIPICSHYNGKTVSAWASLTNGEIAVLQSGSGTARICDTDYATTATNFNNYFAQQYANGTPVTIWYVLATPETAAVNEPLMKIGSYVDEISKTGTGVDIPTVSGSNTLAVGTTVQPSSMSITFRGN